jgi:peptide/nickel transport system permease protein
MFVVTIRFIIGRLVNRLITLLMLVLFSFLVFELIPQSLGFKLGFFFVGITQLNPKTAQAQLAAVDAAEQAYGLNAPIPIRIAKFLYNLFTLHFGMSPTYKEPVLTVISQYLPNTLVLVTVSLVTTSVISIVLGVVAAKSFLKSRWKVGDKVASLTSIGAYFIPAFWLGIIMYVVLAAQLHWFPINLFFALRGGGLHNYTGVEYYLRYLWAASLPIILLTIVGFGHRQQLIRNNIIEEYNAAGYVMYARARGLDENSVFYRHAFRNALLPWVTQVGLDVAFLIYGVFFVETIFQFPGLGIVTTEAATSFDIPLLIGSTFLFSVYILVVLFALDFVYALLDPRVRLGE